MSWYGNGGSRTVQSLTECMMNFAIIKATIFMF